MKNNKVLYTYVSETNKKYADKMALKANRPVSEFINELLSSQRLKRPLKFEPRISKTEQKAQAARERRKQRINELR